MTYGFLRFILFHTTQEGPNSGTNHREDKEIFEISAKGAAVFIVVASVFLLLLFYLMSSWITWVLIVFFCIGGIEVFSCIFSSLHSFDHMVWLFVQMLLLELGYWSVCLVFSISFERDSVMILLVACVLQGMHVCLVTIISR